MELADLRPLAPAAERAARYRAAASLIEAVEAGDDGDVASRRVTDLATRAAGALGLDREQIELKRLAVRLRDLGKLAVPDELLTKQGALSEAERRVIERHPQIGSRILDRLGIDTVARWVLHHHERWDGRGYPDGLAGEAIPLGARIVFVADAFAALTGDRAVRAAPDRGRGGSRARALRRHPVRPGRGGGVRRGDRARRAERAGSGSLRTGFGVTLRRRGVLDAREARTQGARVSGGYGRD